MPRRRTLAAAILAFTRSLLTRFGILPALVSKRRLSGHGQPRARRREVAAEVAAGFQPADFLE
jgi:hypothetical protein